MSEDQEDVDVIEYAIRRIANAICPGNAAPGTDAAGCSVDSLTESVMGVTAGLMAIANSIQNLAEAVNDLSFVEIADAIRGTKTTNEEDDEEEDE